MNTIKEILESTNLNYTVESAPVIASGVELASPLSKNKVLYRSDNNEPLGIVGAGYTPVEYEHAMGFVDNILDESDFKYHSLDSSDNGGVALLTLEKQAMLIRGNDGDMKHRITVSTGHDGKHGLKTGFYTYRQVCTNGMMGWSSEMFVSFRHTMNIESRYDDALRILAESTSYFAKFDLAMDRMSRVVNSDKITDDFLNVVAKGESKRSENIREQISSMIYNGSGTDGSTLYDVYNGFVEWVDTVKGRTTGFDRHETTIIGRDALTKSNAFSYLDELAAAI